MRAKDIDGLIIWNTIYEVDENLRVNEFEKVIIKGMPFFFCGDAERIESVFFPINRSDWYLLKESAYLHLRNILEHKLNVADAIIAEISQGQK